MKLIENWHKKIHKLWTTRLAALGMVAGIAADMIPQVQGVLPNRWYVAVFFLIFVMRIVAQPKVHEDG